MSTNSGRSSLTVLETSFMYTSSSSEEDLRSPLKKNSTQHKREKSDDEKFKRPDFIVTKPAESNSSSNLSSSAITSLNVTSSSNTSSSGVSSCADSFSRFLRTPLSGKTHRRGRHSTCTSQFECNRNTQGSSLSVDEHNIDDDPFNTTFCYTPANETQRSNSSAREERSNSTSVTRKLNLGSHISKSRPALTLNSIKAHLTPKRPSLQQKKPRRQSAAPTVSSASSNNNVSQSDWCKSLESVLSDPDSRNSFLQFLKKEFSEENLEFWTDVQDLKQINGRSKVKQKVKDIYLTYIIDEAPKMLNLTMPVRLTVASNVIKNPADKECFAQAEESIFNLMNSDSFRRFQNSI